MCTRTLQTLLSVFKRNQDKLPISEKLPGHPDRGPKRGHVRGNPDLW